MLRRRRRTTSTSPSSSIRRLRAVIDQVQATGGTTLELRRRLCAKVYAAPRPTTPHHRAPVEGVRGRGADSAGSCPATDGRCAASQSLRLRGKPATAGRALRRSGLFQQLHGKELSYNNILDLTGGKPHRRVHRGRPDPGDSAAHNPAAWVRAPASAPRGKRPSRTDGRPFGGIHAVNSPPRFAVRRSHRRDLQ